MPEFGDRCVLIIGASRGLGLALAQEYLRRGWQVIATVRGEGGGELRLLAAGDHRLRVEQLDMTVPDELTALRERLSGSRVDLLFVNAAVTKGDVEIAAVTTEAFCEVMITNALSPMRVIEKLQDLVPATGTIAVMSSRQGSISQNTNGGHEVYRASKSALNQLMRSYAARHRDDPRTLLLVAPGWVQTELGGPAAPLTIDQSIPGVVDTVTAAAGFGGLHYLDYQNRTVAW